MIASPRFRVAERSSLPAQGESELTSLISERTRPPCLLALFVFGATFAVYSLTAARSLCWGDSAEFVAVASTLGVSHPPGYPLYTLLGALAMRVPHGTPFLRMSILSALFASGAAAAAALTVWMAAGTSPGKGERGNLPRLAGSLFAGGTLAFGPTFWSQAVVPEVYSMAAFLALTALFLFAFWGQTRGRESVGVPSDSVPGIMLGDGPVVLMGLVLGLALAHHLTATFLLVPLVVALFSYGRRPSLRAVLSATALVAVGLSLYAYLPLRAAQGPAILWAPIGTWREFFDHVTGAQFARLLFAAPLAEVTHKLATFFAGVPREVTWVTLALAVPGVAALFRWARAVAFTISIWALLVLGHAAVYRIPDIGSYYIPIYAALAIVAGIGLCSLAAAPRWKRAGVTVAWLAVAVSVALPAMLARDNWAVNDWSERDDGEVYLERMLASIEPGGVVVTMSDRVLFPLWYARYVDRSREDFHVAWIRELAPHLERWAPGVRFPTEDELCSGFEEPSPSPGVSARESIPLGHYLPLFTSLNLGQRHIYADAEVGRQVFLDRSIPRGLLVEIEAAPVDSLPHEDVATQDALSWSPCWTNISKRLR